MKHVQAHLSPYVLNMASNIFECELIGHVATLSLIESPVVSASIYRLRKAGEGKEEQSSVMVSNFLYNLIPDTIKVDGIGVVEVSKQEFINIALLVILYGGMVSFDFNKAAILYCASGSVQ